MRVMQFSQALETALQTLERMRNESAHRPCASRSALDALNQIAPVRENLLEDHAPSATRKQNEGGSSSKNNLAPGADEDAQGEPFVGRAGQLLTKIIKAMGFAREDVYIANILKCRPDVPAGSFGNRAPTPREMQTCRPYLMEQIGIIRPKVIVALGAVAVEGLLGTRAPMRDLRGRWDLFNGTPLMVTYHPAYLLRNQSLLEKRKVWEDMMQVLDRLEKPISEKQRNYFL